MSCALTQDLTLDCRDAIGGIKEVYIIEQGNLGNVTESSGIVTAITNAPNTLFFKYSLIRETSNAEETITGNEQNGTLFFAQVVNLIVNKRNASTRNEIMLIAKNYVTMVVVDNMGKNWLYGRGIGLLLNGGTSGTGTAWGDRNGSTLNFTGSEREMAPEVAANVIATLNTPGT